MICQVFFKNSKRTSDNIFLFDFRFTVYIVIPMHPEGVATDSAIQEMLFWQKHTMHMMYARVAQALHSAGKYLDRQKIGLSIQLCRLEMAPLLSKHY